ncbi:BgTH12-06746 [Blumeria graminis f. sp. triticale]|uniref:Bgt_BCG-9 n=3 Tax=Blumeria graminis TaxID=34373 RepID=A0A381LBH6_BLUGR|nr:BgTH12-06746 [Blumeria graminis f. sp. triticale]VCU41358.1 Bgt_BCG-9 [Blumeria graminis f. sp. tritici]
MKFITAALIASLIGMSASYMEDYDDDIEFDYTYKLPVLDENFKLDCYGSKSYTKSTILRYVQKAISKDRSQRTRLDTYYFLRFYGQPLLVYKAADDRFQDGTQFELHIIMDKQYTFLAGMIKYAVTDPETGLRGTREMVCKFYPGTQFQQYVQPR